MTQPYGQNTVPRSDSKAYLKEWRERNGDRIREYERRKYTRNPERNLWRNARTRARRDNLPFDITEDDIVIPERCPILGIKITKPDGKRKESSASVDKIVPEKGYVRGNIQVISWRANRMKSAWRPEEILALADWIRRQK